MRVNNRRFFDGGGRSDLWRLLHCRMPRPDLECMTNGVDIPNVIDMPSGGDLFPLRMARLSVHALSAIGVPERPLFLPDVS